MASVLLYQEQKKTGPKPAVGRHLEILGDMDAVITLLSKSIALERAGTHDGLGNFWVGYDSVPSAAKKLVALAEQRVAELRDTAP
jgi:hypothetical protein